ncbi:hypothetical protein [Paracoccus ravus]|uniref:hypothetical protein n=1 Tax=Paracoccus ravus TaxID=2447760 RepID=UPI00143041F5|nr:hypothetical protein [Paracoccus ravus]
MATGAVHRDLDETGIANLVICPKRLRHGRIMLTAGMGAARGCIQPEGKLRHPIVHRIADLSAMLDGIGQSDAGLQPFSGRRR